MKKAAVQNDQVRTSIDGVAWDQVCDTKGARRTFTFATRKARYVRIYCTARVPVQVEARRRVHGDPGAATRPASRAASQRVPPTRYFLFKVSVFKD